ncbi:MAG TPA: TolC family protein [Chitinophagaceae bacterium]|nr:TolC family protein [Chitinophagaceae bacterium]
MERCQRILFFVFAVIFLIRGSRVHAQVDTLVHLPGAVQQAGERFPLLLAKKYESDAGIKNVDVIKYSKLPTIDASYQANLSTANNLTGQFYPYGILPMTGPPSISNNYSPATGSAAAVLLNWQAVTFGQRDAQINLSIAEGGTKTAAWKQEAFNQQLNVISKYLDVLLAHDVVAIRQNNLLRVKENLRQSIELAGSGIKPGVDSALFLSELSQAKIDLLNSEKDLQSEQWLLAQFIVTDALPVPADTLFLRQLPSVATITDTATTMHPALVYAEKQFEFNKSKELLLKKSYLPKLNVWGTAFARGSGFEANGSIKALDGLVLSRYNYGAGIQFTFPIMKYGEVKRQLQEQTLLSLAAQERINDTKNTLTTQQRIANTTYANSIAVASELQQQLKSAQYAFHAMQIRYNTGLVNYADLIQAQYDLLKAELDIKKAYLDAWKALLLEAAVRGDINIFMRQIR